MNKKQKTIAYGGLALWVESTIGFVAYSFLKNKTKDKQETEECAFEELDLEYVDEKEEDE